MKKILFASAASILLATPAFAQDFAGPRIEGRIGWDKIGVDVNYDDGTDSLEADGSTDDIAFGGEIGFDLAVGRNGIVGGYAGVDFSNNEVCSEIYGDDEACLSAGRNITVGARFGLIASPRALVYAKAGYSNGKVELDYDDGVDDLEVSDDRGGFHLGAGAEFAFGPNAYGKAEYVYTNYNGLEYDDGDLAAGIDSDRHQFLVGIGFRF